MMTYRSTVRGYGAVTQYEHGRNPRLLVTRALQACDRLNSYGCPAYFAAVEKPLRRYNGHTVAWQRHVTLLPGPAWEI